MDKFKGTNRKWDIHYSNEMAIVVGAYGPMNEICTIHRYSDREEEDANALLIIKALELLKNAQMNVDSLDLSNMEFYNKYGFNVAEVTAKTRELIKEATQL